MRQVIAAVLLLCAMQAPVAAQAVSDGPATRAVTLDSQGVVRWRDTNEEVSLFGANYCIMSGSDYRMSGLVSQNRKAMIDEDMAQFARMGWTALRLCSWGDWENADKDGNLVVNDHVDLMDYLIAKARERGIYILLTPIHAHDPAFADQLGKPSENTGFSRYYDRSVMGTDPKSIAAQANYIGQVLNHINPYTGVALKDEPAILFVELINEPVHHPEDVAGSVAYINRLVKAVRDTGSTKITFFNLTQDVRIAGAIDRSNVDGVTFGWYPSGLVAGRTLKGNFLQAVDSYPDLLRPHLKGKPRIVYEFDTADLATGYLYPAMARTYRSVGAQFASMFAYDMLETAPFNLGWQTHFLNLVHSPRKAVSAVIAAEAMRRLPRFKSYGRYPDDVSFGDFRVSYDEDMSELVADDAFMNAGDTKTPPRDPAKLTRIAGFGSSPLVGYEGTGAYFLDKIRDGVWRLEVYPDEVLVRDPFEQPQPGKIVSRLLYRSWPIALHLPDLGDHFIASPVTVPQDHAAASRQAEQGRFAVEPGVWLLSAGPTPDRASLPARVNRVGFDEYHVNAPVSYPDLALSLTPKMFEAGAPVEIRARVADDSLPDSVKLWIRAAGSRNFGAGIAMNRVNGNDYAAVADKLAPGLYEYMVTVISNGRATTFPGAMQGEPRVWPFLADAAWTFRVVPDGAPMTLFDPKNDYDRITFVRPGETYRQPFFHIGAGERDNESALQLVLPDLGQDTPEQYSVALYVGDIVAARKSEASRAASLAIKLKGAGPAKNSIDVTLIEKDGTSWTAPVTAGEKWSTVLVPLSRFHVARSALTPTPFPALWDYWRETPAHRGGAADRIHVGEVERIEFTVHHSGTPASDGVSVESVWLNFGSRA
jgi:hypothetical protein